MEEPQLPVSAVYDYSRSTEKNYAMDAESAEYVGKYAAIRAQLDYSHHSNYTPERQMMHDDMIDRFQNTIIRDGDFVCDRPLENWLVFTAGCMGAGKGYVMKWLASLGLFPLDAFVRVDPDELRELLPETENYIKRDPTTAGFLTQKEVGYISEVLTRLGLDEGKNVLVDGSLRDWVWYLQYLKSIRREYPMLKIAIIYVTSEKDTILERVKRRAEKTGRLVPESWIMKTLVEVPESMKILAPHVDFFATFENEVSAEPRLLRVSKQVSTNDLASLVDDGRQAYMIDPALVGLEKYPINGGTQANFAARLDTSMGTSIRIEDLLAQSSGHTAFSVDGTAVGICGVEVDADADELTGVDASYWRDSEGDTANTHDTDSIGSHAVAPSKSSSRRDGRSRSASVPTSVSIEPLSPYNSPRLLSHSRTSSDKGSSSAPIRIRSELPHRSGRLLSQESLGFSPPPTRELEYCWDSDLAHSYSGEVEDSGWDCRMSAVRGWAAGATGASQCDRTLGSDGISADLGRSSSSGGGGGGGTGGGGGGAADASGSGRPEDGISISISGSSDDIRDRSVEPAASFPGSGLSTGPPTSIGGSRIFSNSGSNTKSQSELETQSSRRTVTFSTEEDVSIISHPTHDRDLGSPTARSHDNGHDNGISTDGNRGGVSTSAEIGHDVLGVENTSNQFPEAASAYDGATSTFAASPAVYSGAATSLVLHDDDDRAASPRTAAANRMHRAISERIRSTEAFFGSATAEYYMTAKKGDNEWWREKFRAVWKMECALPTLDQLVDLQKGGGNAKRV